MTWDGACAVRRWPGRTVLLAALLAGIVAATPVAATAAPGFTAPITYPLPSGATAGETQVGYAAGGITTIAWLQIVSTSPVYDTVLHAGVIAPGGAYVEQLQIPSTSTSVPIGFQLAEAPNGAAVLEYTISASDQPGIGTAAVTDLASYRAAGAATWEAPATIASDTTQAAIQTELVPAIAPDGTAAAGVDHLDPAIPNPGGARIDVAVHPTAGAWSAATRISPSSKDSEDLRLAFDASDDLTAAFTVETATPGRYTLGSVRRPATSGIWGSLEDLTGSDVTSSAGVPVLAVAPDGSAVIAFQYVHYAAPNTLDVNAVTRSGEGGAWSAPADVVPGGASSVPYAAGISADDHAYILYSFQGTSSAQDCVGAVRALVGSAFTSRACVSATNFQTGAYGRVALLGDDAYFEWTGNPDAGTSHAIQASRWTAGEPGPEAGINLDDPGPPMTVVSMLPDQDGSVAAFWASGTGASVTLRAAAFDAGGPNLVSASVPAQGTTGQPIAMSASFADLWSGLGPGPAWDFGDGGSATGGSVTHAYAAPGTYQVTVTSSDGLGNQTAEHYSIVVSAPPPATHPASPLRMTHVGQKASRWTEPGGHRRRHRSIRVGTSFRFTLNQPAGVKLTFLRPTVGHRVKHRCRPGRGHHAKRCVLMARVGTIRLSERAGRSTVPFNGTIAHHRLPPGAYAVTITAGSGATAVSRTVHFRIVAGGR
ncbi:MAG: PKD domain-containing protein [Solirubrobacteraceae bacterium]